MAKFKYELVKQKKTYKIASEKQTLAVLSTKIQANNELTGIFDDGNNKLHIIAKNTEKEMQEWCERKTVGFVKQNKIYCTVNENHTRADFYSSVDSDPFCSIIKKNEDGDN